MKKFLPFFCLLLIITDRSLCVLFRQTPKGEFWKGYSVMYVSNNVSDYEIRSLLDSNGITDYSCLSNQYLPVNLSADSLEVKLIPFNNKAVDYLSKKENYFTDKTGCYNLYYIPVSFKNRINSCISKLNNGEVKAGLDASSSYPFVFPSAVILLILFFTFFSKKKIMFFCSSIFSFLYSLSFPYLSSMIASVVLLFCLFVFSQIYGRKDFLKLFLKRIEIFILIGFSIVNSFFSSISAGFCFIALITCVSAFLIISDSVNSLHDQKMSFRPVLIRSSKKIKVFNGKEKILFPVSIGLIVFSFVFSLFSFDITDSASKKISLPSSAASIKNSDFPVMEDYYNWYYSVQTFPYQSLNNDFYDSSSVSYNRYIQDDGKIIEKEQSYIMNQDFCDIVYGQIDSLKFNAFEKIMKKQGDDYYAGWSVTGSHQNNIFSIIISFMQFMLISIYFVGLLFKSNRGRK